MTSDRTLTRLLTTSEVAELLHVHPKTVARLRKCEGLPFLRVGGRIRFDAIQVARWLSDRKEATT
jgi:excisionase family DNA binding protein